MKNKVNEIFGLFQVIGVIFVLISLQIWYIITGNE
jgi:hypothetical protein